MTALRMAVLLAAVALSGCLERPRNEVVDGPPGRAAAVDIANLALVEYDLRPIQPDLVKVTWMTGDCLESRNIDGCVDGAHYGLCDIFVLAKDVTWADSEFSHEIIHCAIFDEDHEWPQWAELVRVIRERLADADL